MGIDRVRTRVSHASFCPECSGNLMLTGPDMPHVVCPNCAAIAIMNGAKGGYRLLKTVEWLDILNAPNYWALLELREATMERLTAPVRHV